MSKPVTIEAIETSACEVFCRDGFDGASLREIANHAGVSLSSIHEYFESKVDLYIHVGMRLFERVEGQRRQTLNRLTSRGEIDLRAVVHSLVAPVILPEPLQADIEPHHGERAWTPAKLRTWYDTTAFLGNYPEFREQLGAAATAWVGRICDCCPGLSWTAGRLAYTLVASTLYTWGTTNRYVNETLQVPGSSTPQQECESLARFICAGIRALVTAGA
jgi:AcrR family transcriptional regulator